MGIMARPGKYKYRIYLNETNELIASGLRKECIKQLNMDPVQFDNFVNNVTRGRSRKYRIDREDNDAHDIYNFASRKPRCFSIGDECRQ